MSSESDAESSPLEEDLRAPISRPETHDIEFELELKIEFEIEFGPQIRVNTLKVPSLDVKSSIMSCENVKSSQSDHS